MQIKITCQTGSFHKGYKPIILIRVSSLGPSLCSSLRALAAFATPKGVN